MATSKTKMLKDYHLLNKSEKKVYKSVMANFPETSHESALDKALQGGTNFQFNPK